MAKSKKKTTTFDLKSFTFDPISLEPISKGMEPKNSTEGPQRSHLDSDFTVTSVLIKQIIDALKKV